MTKKLSHRFLPHTEQDEKVMLAAIGVSNLEELFKCIPENLREHCLNFPSALSEEQLIKEMKSAAICNQTDQLLFLGAGAYDHFIPSIVWQLASRGEFSTSYTPYQPEVSQGTLQIAFEFQSMICDLLDMEVANSSLYDGGSALAEAVLMSNRIVRKQRVLVSSSIHPSYLKTLKTLVHSVGIQVDLIAEKDGKVDTQVLEKLLKEPTSAVILQQPNFYGLVESIAVVSQLAKQQGALTIAAVNPVACAILSPPGKEGADIVCGEGQPLGLPLSFGGPYFGFLATRMKHVRQMPGRIIGKTRDLEGKEGYVLTLQTREQHIRREKSTSNICTNQFLCALAATIHLSALGKVGLVEVARQCVDKSHYLKENLSKLDQVEIVYEGAFFHEFVIRTPMNSCSLLESLNQLSIVGGLSLELIDSSRSQELLICVTERRSKEELDRYVESLESLLSQAGNKETSSQLGSMEHAH